MGEKKESKKYHIFQGNIAHCQDSAEVELIEDGFIIVEGTKIVAMGLGSAYSIAKARLGMDCACQTTRLTSSQLLIPGFIDTNIHANQYANCGLGYDKPLLDWLFAHNYPLELKMKDNDFANKAINAVVRKTLSHGTTTAMYYGSIFETISLILVDSAIKYGQRALVGKVNINNMAPPSYKETTSISVSFTKSFIQEIKARNSPLISPVITPGYALSCDMPLMKELATIAREGDYHIQTNLAENVREVELVQKRYGKCYTNVYDEAGLLTPKTVLAHGIHLSDDEIALLSKKGCAVAHCPASNWLLHSGICRVKKLLGKGVNVSLGTDVAGGASPSMISTMRDAIASSSCLALNDTQCECRGCLDWKDAFYMGTLGGAKALRMDNKIGNFQNGKEFDAVIIDADVTNSSVDYLIPVTPLENLQKVIYTGDDRNVVNVYVAGREVK